LFNNVLVVAEKEFNRLRKSFFFWAGLILISLAPELLNNPIQDGRVLCTSVSVAYYVMDTAVFMDMIAIPLLIGYICFYDDKTEIESVILTQPIDTKGYALGRFLAVFSMWLFLSLIRVGILLFVPLYFKAAPYSLLPFMQATIFYVLPAAFYFAALSYLILIISKSPTVTVIVTIVLNMIQTVVLQDTILDFRLSNRVQVLVSNEKLHQDFLIYFITSRCLLILLGAIFLAAAIFIYKPEKNKIQKVNKLKTSGFKLNYNFRIQSKVVRTVICLIAFICLVLIAVSNNSGDWYKIKMFICLIPMFFIVNVLADEYAAGRDMVLFTCKTSIYKQMLTRILYGWIFGQGILILYYVIAFFKGYESNLLRLITMIALSTFLSLLGLTASNLSKKPLLGVIVPVIYFMFVLAQGAMFNETYSPISVINLMLTSQIVWVNLLGLVALSVIMLLFNIWYVGKGERIRRPLVNCTAVVLIILCGGVGIYSYLSYSKALIQNKIINSKDTIYVLNSKNSIAEAFLKNRGLKYSTAGAINENDISKSNIVVISDSDNKKFSNMLMLDNDGLQVKDFNIVGTSCFRFTTLNPKNNKKYMIFMQSKEWKDKELNLLFKEKKGNFLAAEGDKCLAKSNYNIENNNSMVDNLEICDKGAWLMKKKEDVKIMYRDVPKAEVTIDDLLDIWYSAHKEINKMVKNNSVGTVQIYFKAKSKENLSSKAVKIQVNDRRFFDAPKENLDERWTQTIA
ncbi:hypothetical protein JMF89_18325, partial [Clostridiaceae bacterium UIB06]|nr:hypothetical protein [Clostridiaceae bacterium UIB06]